jgi:hypothetical protein
LGRLQPIRLINKFPWDGARIRSKYTTNNLHITKIEEVGEKEVIDIQVSTRAFLANGLVTHNCYYEDNDYVRRAIGADIQSCTVLNSYYFHFWSRTIHQGSGGSNSLYFNLNRNFYIIKWGGDFGQEKYDIPFNGKTYKLGPGIEVPSTVNLQDRSLEKDIVHMWRAKGK